MADKSKIEWTDATWNPVTGCSVLSPGCTNCYAMKLAGTRLRNHPSRAGLTKHSKAGPVWTGEVHFNEGWLTQPLSWRKPRMVFVCAHGDLFHDDVPDAWIDQVFAVMALAPQHNFQVLTKRAKRMRQYLSRKGRDLLITWARAIPSGTAPMTQQEIETRLLPGLSADHRNLFHASEPQYPLPNVWLGVSAERQQEADERIPDLLQTPAAIRFVSLEPLLSPISLIDPLYSGEAGFTMRGYLRDPAEADDFHHHATKLDWVIVGGESGDGARPMHPDWLRQLRDQCAGAGVPFFFKQWGTWAPSTPEQAAGNPHSGWQANRAHPHVAKAEELYPDRGAAFVARVGKAKAGRLLDGVEHNEFPKVPA